MPQELSQGLSRASELNAIGAQLFAQGQLEPARLHFLGALMLEAEHPQALQNLGATLRNLNHFEAALSVAKRSVAAQPGNSYALANLGVSYFSLKKYEAAYAILRDVVEIAPEISTHWHNYGLVLYTLGRFSEALTAFDTSLELQPNNPQGESDRALTYLQLGHLEKGLALYEVRWKLLKRSWIWDLPIPEWQGEDIKGLRVLVHHEQGFGDSLMLVRFVSRLEAMGAHVTFAVPPELIRLYRESLSIYIEIVDFTDEKVLIGRHFDYHTPMLSVVRHLKIKGFGAISSLPYLRAPEPENFAKLLKKGAEPVFRIGICWASGNHGPQLLERRRLVPVTDFLPFTELPGVAVISLQKGAESADLGKTGMSGLVLDLSARLVDFAATAEVIENLDLVITVDSAVAHLAGALGKDCFMLSPYARCWRWQSKISGSPWYSGMKIFAQEADGSWNSALGAAFSIVRRRSAKVRSSRDIPAPAASTYA